MKNKGFTLIELLAVIVILAIIALIATPVIMNIINGAQADANNRSAELMASAAQLAYQQAYAQTGAAPTLTDVVTKLYNNGVSNATVDKTANTITDTKSNVVCTLKNETNVLKMTCTGTTEDANINLTGMTLKS